MSQYNDTNTLRPVAYFFKRHSPAKCNYEIYEKELMAIIRCFEAWRPELEGSAFPINVLNDHKNLEYFMTTKALSRRQARWSEYLSQFDFKILYQPRKINGKADALTRRSGDFPSLEDEQVVQQSRVILKPENFLRIHSAEILADDVLEKPLSDSSLSDINELDLAQLRFDIQPDELSLPQVQPSEEKEDEDSAVDIEQLWVSAYGDDSDPVHQIIDTLQKNRRQDSVFRKLRMSMSDCELQKGRLFYRNRMYIPDSSQLRLHLIRQAHSSPSGGHGDKSRTFEILSRHYFCPGLADVLCGIVRNVPAPKSLMKSTMVCFNPCPCRLEPGKKLLWIL